MKSYLWNPIIGYTVNAILAGSPTETPSSRAHRMRMKGQRYWGWTAKAINMIFFWEEDHCREAYENSCGYGRSQYH